MGFWDEHLNEKLLHENKMEIEKTVEKLLESSKDDSFTGDGKLTLTMDQRVLLLNYFLDDEHPNQEKRQQIAEMTKLTEKEVASWFEDRRVLARKDQQTKKRRDEQQQERSLENPILPPPGPFSQDHERYHFLDFD